MVYYSLIKNILNIFFISLWIFYYGYFIKLYFFTNCNIIMSDLTFPLIGLTTLAGYFFSRDGRNPRTQETVRETIEELIEEGDVI